MKRCGRCREVKSHAEFGKNAAKSDGRQGYCLPCERAYGTEYRVKHRERRRAQGARWYASNREHVRASAKAERDALKLELIEAYGGACACCGETEPIFLTLDHIDGVIPDDHRNADGSRQGGHVLYRRIRREGYPTSCRVLCWNCNAAHGLFGYCPHERHLRKVS